MLRHTLSLSSLASPSFSLIFRFIVQFTVPRYIAFFMFGFWALRSLFILHSILPPYISPLKGELLIACPTDVVTVNINSNCYNVSCYTYLSQGSKLLWFVTVNRNILNRYRKKNIINNNGRIPLETSLLYNTLRMVVTFWIFEKNLS